MNGARPVLIMAGGTGGHVFPALAVAERLRARGVPVTWMGTRQGLEAVLVPKAGIPIEWIGVAGLRGKGVRNAATGQTGDHLVTVEIVMPEEIDDKLSYFMQTWRSEHGYKPRRRS